MHTDLNAIQQSHELAPEDLVSLVRSTAVQVRSKASTLRGSLDRGTLFRMVSGPQSDELLIYSCLMAIVIAEMPVPEGPFRSERIRSMNLSCQALGVDYEEVLRLSHDHAIIANLIFD